MQINQFQNRNFLRKAEQNSWRIMPFNKLLVDETKLASKIKKENYLATGNYPIIDQGKKLIGGFTDETKGLYKNKPYIIFGDHTRILKYIDFPSFIGADGVKLLKNMNPEEVLTKYLYYFLKTIDIPNTGYNRHFKYLKEVIIPIPSKNVQVKIVEVLDKANELIELRKKQIIALSSLTQSVFLEMFGDPILNNSKYRYTNLSNLTVKVTDGTHHSPPMVENGVPYISAKHLGKGNLDFYRDTAYVSEKNHQEIYKRCDPVKGDVLYIKDGATTGIAAINHYDFQFSMLSSLALIKCDLDKLNNYYLVYYLNNTKVKEKILNNMSGGAIKRLTLKKINDIEIMIPPIELQNEFSLIIQFIEEKSILFNKSLMELENNYKSLVQSVFNGELFKD